VSSIDISVPASHEVSLGTLDDTNRAQLQALALARDGWREAESHVKARWSAFLAADRPAHRRPAFAGYLAALDAEAAAAEALAHTHVDLAAAA
jgi:hypothetical protein